MKSVQIRSFFWSVFSYIRTEYGDLGSTYAVRIQKNTDQKKLRIWTLFTQWCLQSKNSKLSKHWGELFFKLCFAKLKCISNYVFLVLEQTPLTHPWSVNCTAQKMNVSIKDFFLVNVTKSTENCGFGLRIWSHLLKKALMKNFIFYAVMSCVW